MNKASELWSIKSRPATYIIKEKLKMHIVNFLIINKHKAQSIKQSTKHKRKRTVKHNIKQHSLLT